jgi:hypothetical protein
MGTFYRLLADLVVTAHFGYVAFVVIGFVMIVAGGVLGWRWVRNIWFRGLHLGMILVVVGEAWLGIVCPLTTWELKLRRLAGQASYQGGFIPNLLHDLMFFNAEPWVFTLAYTLFGLAVFGTLALIPPKPSAGENSPR